MANKESCNANTSLDGTFPSWKFADLAAQSIPWHSVSTPAI
jgi:hypothetical protein